METRTYQGHTYQRSAPGDPWTLVASAPRVGQIISSATSDLERPKLTTEIDNARSTMAARAAEQARDAALQPFKVREAAANATKAEADASQATGGEGELDPATITYYAQQVLSGAQMPSIGMGKQAASARQAIMKEVARLGGASGMTGADQAAQIAHYKAGSAQIGNLEKMVGTIGVNEQTALANGQQFIDRSAELPGQTSIAPLNAISDWIQRRFGGTTISAMDAAHTTFVNEYAKVVAGSPSGAGTLSDSARREAMDTIQSNASLAQKQAAFAQMKTDMANRMTAIHGGINEAYKALTNHPGYQVPDATQGLPLVGAGSSAQNGGVMPGGGIAPPGSGGGSPPPTMGGGGGGTIATGATKAVDDPVRSKAVEALLRQGADFATINAVNKQMGGMDLNPQQIAAAAALLKQHPEAHVRVDTTGEAPTTAFNRLAGSTLGQGVIDVGAAAGSGLNAASGGIINRVTGGAVDKMEALAPKSSIAGSLVGGALGAAGGEALLGNLGARAGTGLVARALSSPITADAIFGGVSGANADPNAGLGESLTNGIIGAGVGAGGGALGRRVGQALGSAVRGVSNPAVQYLRDAGVPLTAGQALGGIAKNVEDRLSGIPFVGDMVRNRRLEGIEGFNRAAFNEGMAPINATTNGVVGEQGIDAARGAISGQGGAYDQALAGVTLTPDQPFQGSVAAALAQGASLPRVGPEFGAFVNNSIAPHFSAPNGQINGRQVQDILQQVRGADFGTDSMGSMASDAGRGIEGAVMDLADRQAPGAMEALGNANTAYRNLNILSDAVGKGINNDGLFMPSQLGTAARSNATKFGGKIAAATPDRPFYELQRAGQEVLPSRVPDSGTAGRLALMSLPGALGAAGLGAGAIGGDAQSGGEAGLVAGALLTAGGSRTAQRAIVSALLDRPQVAMRVGNSIYNNANIARLLGVSSGAAALDALQ